MKFFVDPELVAEIAAAPAALLIDGGLGPFEPFAHIKTWRFACANDAVYIYQGPSPAVDRAAPYPGAPLGVVGVLARDAGVGERVVKAWLDGGGVEPPEVILAAEGAAGLRRLIDAAARHALHMSQSYAAANKALAAVRAELEETRLALTQMARRLSLRSFEASALLIDGSPSADGLSAALPAGAWARQKLGAKIDNLSAIDVHIASIDPTSDKAALGARLVAIESAQIVGAWKIPASDLSEGWLRLDLPTPAPALAQSASLDFLFVGGEGDRIALSLDDRPGDDEVHYESNRETVSQRNLALRVFTAELGSRFIAARHWLWDEIGASLPLDGVQLHLPSEQLRRFRALVGAVRCVDVGDAARPILTLEEQPNAVLALPFGRAAGADAVTVTLNVVSGSSGAVEAAMWLAPSAAEIATLADLQHFGPRLKYSGRRRFDASSGAAAISMTFPDAEADACQLIVEVRKEILDKDVYLIELSDVALHSRHAPPRPRPRPAVAKPSAPVAAEPARVANFDRLTINQIFEQQDYAHIDVSVEALKAGAKTWPRVRFKLAVFKGAGHIEFRRGPSWPDALSPDVEFHGESVEFTRERLQAFLAEHAGTDDAELLRAVATNAPSIIGMALRNAQMPEPTSAALVEAFRDFASAAAPPPA